MTYIIMLLINRPTKFASQKLVVFAQLIGLQVSPDVVGPISQRIMQIAKGVTDMGWWIQLWTPYLTKLTSLIHCLQLKSRTGMIFCTRLTNIWESMPMKFSTLKFYKCYSYCNFSRKKLKNYSYGQFFSKFLQLWTQSAPVMDRGALVMDIVSTSYWQGYHNYGQALLQLWPPWVCQCILHGHQLM